MNQSRIKLGIYGVALLMMGVIGVSGALSTIGAHFPGASQTMIQNMISIPCLIVIPVTLIVGKLMSSVSKKALAVTGVLLFLVGGVLPALLDSLGAILVLRGVLGVGIGIIQPVASALVAENFEGAERDRVQGNVTSAQMLGCAVMVFAGGSLAAVSWNLAFWVHLLAVAALLLVLTCLPNTRPDKGETRHNGPRPKLTGGAWVWAGTMFVLFIGAQIYSVYLAYIVTEKALGTAAQSGSAMAFFAIGGFFIGLVFGKLTAKARNLTLSVGLAGILAAYLVIAFAANLPMIYLGAFLFGVSLSICMPCIIVGTGNAVNAAASGMAISVTMCAQNLAQFLCPYLVNPLTAALGNGANNNQLAFLLGAALTAVMLAAAVLWGVRENRKTVSTNR